MPLGSPFGYRISLGGRSRYLGQISNGCGCSSGVEHDLAKVGVEGSNPFARSNFQDDPVFTSAVRGHPLLSPGHDLFEFGQRSFKFVIEEPHHIENFAEADRESQSPARCVGRLGAALLPGDAPFAAGAGGCTDLGVTVVRIAPAPAFEETMRSGDLAEDDATGQLAAPINHATPQLAYV